MRLHDRLALLASGEDALFMLPHQAMNPYWTPQDGNRCYRSFEHLRMRLHPPGCPGRRDLDYRQWYRWVKAK
jgi:hypothetical protein